MNRDDLKKILPKEEICNPRDHTCYEGGISTCVECVKQSRNKTIKDCLDALLKAGVGLVPKIDEMVNELNYFSLIKCHSNRSEVRRMATALRALMLSGGDK